MTTIKRFTPDYAMHAARFEPFAREAEHGEYVRFDDHQQQRSCKKCGDKLPVKECPCVGDGACWLTLGWHETKLTV